MLNASQYREGYMDIRIKKLTPELIDDYIYFFEEVAYEDCYCTYYCSVDQRGIDFHSKDFRKESAIQYIKDAKIQGYLAYINSNVVGWCNVNNRADCINSEGWRIMLSSVNDTQIADEGERIKSIFCFIKTKAMEEKL